MREKRASIMANTMSAWRSRSPAVATVIILVTVGALSGCVDLKPPAPYTALKIPRAQLQGQIHTICLHPLNERAPLPQAEAKTAQLEKLLATHLEAAGFSVVPSAQVKAVWDEVKQQRGGYFDPFTGQVDARKLAAIKQTGYRELNHRLGCDAVLIPTIALVTASFSGGIAKWDSTSDVLAFLASGYGYVPALSLWVSVRDLHDQEIYFGTGGIEVVEKLDSGLLRDQFTQVPVEKLLTNSERNEAAVTASLESLTQPNAEKVRKAEHLRARSGLNERYSRLKEERTGDDEPAHDAPARE